MQSRASRARAREAAAAVESAAPAWNTCLGYASRLSEYADKGVTGIAEKADSARVLQRKLAQLVELFEASDTIVALTGAGISTAAGLPDFRGPRGIWTLEDRKKRRRGAADDDDGDAPAGASFEAAAPTPTHMALVALERRGLLAFCATQNVDGLDLRSGLTRAKLGILHGCVFTERCEACGAEAVHDCDLGGVALKPTGRFCRCGARMLDTVLDWDDALPESEWGPATAAFEGADLCLALGTSLRIVPAADLPLLAKKFVVVNLQKTPLDADAALVIRAKVDDVMAHLLRALRVDPLPAPQRKPEAPS
ncbi:DHS-like NAD/FAD-binding domain-containing protein [Pelagophyceae sp. CCMP2097]|nr:DHS-like NAD/FAD-binding domain-containing protein [Pelagophyceae sp. CCMP2097]